MNKHSAFYILLATIMFLVYPCYVMLVPNPATGWDILIPAMTWIVPLCLGFANLGYHGIAVKSTDQPRGYPACVERKERTLSSRESNVALIALMKGIERELGKESHTAPTDGGDKLNAALPAPRRHIVPPMAEFDLLSMIIAYIEVNIESTASDGIYEEPMARYPKEMEVMH